MQQTAIRNTFGCQLNWVVVLFKYKHDTAVDGVGLNANRVNTIENDRWRWRYSAGYLIRNDHLNIYYVLFMTAYWNNTLFSH